MTRDRHQVNFKIKLTGSMLFDLNTINVARKLCMKFPGLETNRYKNMLYISGSLDDFWYDKWNKAIFEAKTLEDIDREV